MKILKKIGIAIVALIVLLLIISLFLPGTMHVERSVTINAPAGVVFDQVNTVKNWEQWSPWLKMDTTMKVTYNDTLSGTGAGYSWTSTEMGTGTMTLTNSKRNELVDTRLEFGDNGGANSAYRFEADGNALKVTTTFDPDKTANPIHKYMGMIMRGFLETQMDKGLNEIKRIAESAPPPPQVPEVKVEATTNEEINYLAVRDTANMTDIGPTIGAGLAMVGLVMKKQGLQMAGAPFVIYYTQPPADFIMDIAAKVDKPGKASGNVKPGVIKAGNAVVAHYFGDYMKMHSGYEALKKWIADNNKKIIGNPWEVYVTDPGMEKDTAKWQTDIYFPVE
jgi:effector-binding domain-containing protein/ribosome-associated toxin RatA of RatAB toxin-antitoxin module